VALTIGQLAAAANVNTQTALEDHAVAGQ